MRSPTCDSVFRGVVRLAHARALVDLERNRVQVGADAHAEAGIAVAQLLEAGLVVDGALLQRLEELQRGEPYGHSCLPKARTAGSIPQPSGARREGRPLHPDALTGSAPRLPAVPAPQASGRLAQFGSGSSPSSARKTPTSPVLITAAAGVARDALAQ